MKKMVLPPTSLPLFSLLENTKGFTRTFKNQNQFSLSGHPTFPLFSLSLQIRRKWKEEKEKEIC